MALAITEYPTVLTRETGTYTISGTDFGTDPAAVLLEVGRDVDYVEWATIPVLTATGTAITFEIPRTLDIRNVTSRYRFDVTVGGVTAASASHNVSVAPLDTEDYNNIGEIVSDPKNISALYPGMTVNDQAVYGGVTSPGNYPFLIDSSGFYDINFGTDPESDQSFTHYLISYEDGAVSPRQTTTIAAGTATATGPSVHTPPMKDANGVLVPPGTSVTTDVRDSAGAFLFSQIFTTDADSRLLVENDLLGSNGDVVSIKFSLSNTVNVTGSATVYASGTEDTSGLPALNPERAFSVQTMMSGASWTNNGMPVWYDNAVNAASGATSPATIISVVNGSDMAYRWNHDFTGSTTTSARQVLEAGTTPVDVFAITDLSSMTPSQNVIDHAVLWTNLAHTSNTEMYFYALHGRNTYAGTDNAGFAAWNTDNDDRIANWETLYNAVATAKDPAAPAMKMIPVGLIYKRIYDAMIAGTAPADFNQMYVLFGDTHETLGDPHPSYIGRFIISLAHYAAIYRRSPVGLPSYNALTGRTEIWTAATLEWVQTAVWEVVRDYQYSGVRQFVNDPDWVVTTTLDELVVHASPTDGATSHTIRLVGDTVTANYTTLAGALPKTFPGLAAGDYEVSEDQAAWHGPIAVEGVVDTSIVLAQSYYYSNPGNPKTAVGPNSAFVVSGDPIDVDVPLAADGDRILYVGTHRTSNTSGMYGNALAPEEYFGPAIYHTAPEPVEFPGAVVSFGVSTGLKSASVPDLFSNIAAAQQAHGFAFVVTGSNAVTVSTFNVSAGGVNAIDLPEVANVPAGSMIINMVVVGANGRAVLEPSDCTTLMNRSDVSGAMTTYISTEVVRAGTLPARTISLNGSAVPMRALRVIIEQSGV